MRYFALVALLLLGCEEEPTPPAVGVPANAVVLVSAPTLGELRGIAEFVEPLAVDKGADEGQPAWFACDSDFCVLHRGAPAKLRHKGAVWHVPDASGSLVVWGAENRAALDEMLARWRGGSPPQAGWSGFVEPALLLKRWQATSPRSKELVERVTFQANRIDFEAQATGDVIDAQLRMQPSPGEPVLVGELGRPTADVPDLAGLMGGPLVGALRVSADPHRLFELMRSVLTSEQRGELDALQATLKAEYALDFEAQVLDAVSGHVLVFAYGVDPKHATGRDLVTLRTTEEAIVVPVRDREVLRSAIDAWTQLSKARLRVQNVKPTKQEWAWFEDDEILWTLILGKDYLAVVDSSAALDQVRQWRSDPSAISPALERRGASSLLGGRTRSGFYLDLVTLRAELPELFASVPPALQSLTITAAPADDGELVRLRVTTRPLR